MCKGWCKKFMNFFGKYPLYNSLVHLTLGMGLGILITYPFVGIHPLRWAGALLVVGGLGHLYPLVVKK
jgi:hypothetical protein